MGLPLSGPLSMEQINTELSFPTAQIISLNDTAVRALAKTPAGMISLFDFYGKSNASAIAIVGYSKTSQASYAMATDVLTAFSTGYPATNVNGTRLYSQDASYMVQGESPTTATFTLKTTFDTLTSSSTTAYPMAGPATQGFSLNTPIKSSFHNYRSTPVGTQPVLMESFSFITEAFSINSNSLPVNYIVQLKIQNQQTNAFVFTGVLNIANNISNVTYEYSFSTQSFSPAPTCPTVFGGSSFNSPTAGYIAGGFIAVPTATFVLAISKFNFSNITWSNVSALTDQGREHATTFNSTTDGYNAGSSPNSNVPQAARSSVSKFPFSTEVMALATAGILPYPAFFGLRYTRGGQPLNIGV